MPGWSGCWSIFAVGPSTPFDGDAQPRQAKTARSGLCADQWTRGGAELANPAYDFTIVGREDGIRQWAYKGKPLYNFTGDLEQGDANGIGADKDWHVAMLVRYFIGRPR